MNNLSKPTGNAYLTVLKTINYQLSTINYQLSTINYQLSTINYQLSTINPIAIGNQLTFTCSLVFPNLRSLF